MSSKPKRSGALTCPSCRYDMTGLREPVCPECGFRISRSRMGFQVSHWNVPPFYLGALAIVLGFIPAIWANIVIMRAAGIFGRMDGADRLNSFLLIAWIAGLVTLGIAWINWSGIMAAWPRWRHWLVACICWLLPLGGTAIAYAMGTLPF